MTVPHGVSLSWSIVLSMVQLKHILWSSQAHANIAVRSICKCKVNHFSNKLQETCVNTHHWQVAQTVSHVMLDHMSSSGVMHGDGRQCGEELVRHKVKRQNISAVHRWYCNRDKQSSQALNHNDKPSLCQRRPNKCSSLRIIEMTSTQGEVGTATWWI